MPQQVKKSLVLSIYFALAVSTLLVFWQVRNFDFVNYDDNVYIYENPHVLNGLTADAVSWAFTTGFAEFWHPLTWLSLMLDCQLFGSKPAGFHFTNLILHIANVLLVFLVLKRMTNAIWQSAFVAALFALHPLHVESVAWVSERKDVLSTFFWLLSMLAYARYVKQSGASRYLLTLLIFALGLMAKPMLVTLPFVFLLLDYWPLYRIKHFDRQVIYRLVLEKIPFIILSIASSVIAFLAQQGSSLISSFVALPSLKFRIGNALISYAKYIEKMFWPGRLSVFYPHPGENVSVLYAVISAAVLLAVTILVIRFAKNYRYLVTGWFWYLGTLVPVIGIVRVGGHAMADRYTYITLTGLFIIIAWYLPQLLSKWTSANFELPQRKIALGLSMVLVLTTLGICAHRQTSCWNNSFTLFSHALEVTQNNYIAHYNLGFAYSNLGRWQDAIDAYKQTIRIKPDYAEAHTSLGFAYGNLGRGTESIEAYKQAIKIKPGFAEAHYNLGIAYGKLGSYQEQIEAYKQAVRIKPDYAEAFYNLGLAYGKLGSWQEAMDAYKQAIKIKPDYVEARNNLGFAYGNLGRWQDAIDVYKQAIKINPDDAEARSNLGVAYGKLDRYQEAIDAFKQALKIKPDFAEAHCNLGFAYLEMGDKNSALAEYNILKSLNSKLANNLFKEINK